MRRDISRQDEGDTWKDLAMAREDEEENEESRNKKKTRTKDEGREVRKLQR